MFWFWRNCDAASARRCDSDWFMSVLPLESVCPTMSSSVLGHLVMLAARLCRLVAAPGLMTSEPVSYSSPDAKVMLIPSPTRSTVAPGMLSLSSFACWSIWLPMITPVAPPTMAPMIAPRAVEPVLLPITAPMPAPVAAPMAPPLALLLLSAAHPPSPMIVAPNTLMATSRRFVVRVVVYMVILRC